LIDDRAEFVTRQRFPDERIELVAATNWTVAVREAIGNGRGVSVAVVTRGHNEDEECMQAIITTNAAAPSKRYAGIRAMKAPVNVLVTTTASIIGDSFVGRCRWTPTFPMTRKVWFCVFPNWLRMERRGNKWRSSRFQIPQ